MQFLGDFIFLNMDFLFHKRAHQPNQSYYALYVLTHEIYHYHERLSNRILVRPSGPDKPGEDPKIRETIFALVSEYPQYLPLTLGGTFNFHGERVVKRFRSDSLQLKHFESVNDLFIPSSFRTFLGFSS
jgi:hypothetical protein